MILKKLWEKIIKRGHDRSVKAKKNILKAVFYKGLGTLIGFIYVPLSAAYLGETKYGIFLVLVSIMDWFQELDIGIGNGLRNRLGEAIADGDIARARGYVSTAYFILGSIFSVVSLLFLIACFFIPWSDWLNTDPSLNREIMILAILMFAAFAFRFVASLVYQIFYALQEVGMIDFFETIGKMVFLFIILILIYFTEGSLLFFGASKTFTFALVPFVVGLYFFNKSFRKFRPSIKLIKKSFFKSLFSLGVQFFIIKSSMIVIYSTNAFLIARFVSIDAVPQYDTAYKLLAVFLLLFNIITNQMWSANIEAYRKKDFQWMKSSMKKIKLLWFYTVLMAFGLVLISPIIYKYWLQGTIQSPSLLLTFAIAISICTTTWVNSFNLVINGTGMIRLQMYAWIAAALINIPASIFFATTVGFGILGIVLGTIVSLLPLAILSPIQVRKILRNSHSGIWGE